MNIDSFRDEYAFLSNFYPVQVIGMDGFAYPTVEHAFQAAKTDVPEEQRYIRAAATTSIAKRRGRVVTLRRGWDDMRLDVMRELLANKFRTHPKLRAQLLDTRGQMLVEGNRWGDTYWGVCRGVGYNHLGRLLMKLRAELAVGAPHECAYTRVREGA